MTLHMVLPTVVPIVRFHVSLNVTNLERSVRFYEILFDRPPAKLRDDYAKFETGNQGAALSTIWAFGWGTLVNSSPFRSDLKNVAYGHSGKKVSNVVMPSKPSSGFKTRTTLSGSCTHSMTIHLTAEELGKVWK
jgi:hypothetical protein